MANDIKPKKLDYSKPSTPDATERTLDYSKMESPKTTESKWRQTMRERKSAKHKAATNYQTFEAKGNTFVKSDLQKADEKKPAFGTDIEKAKADLEGYEKRMPRMVESIKNSNKKAPEKKKMLAYIDRMHKYFQKGVEYALEMHNVKNDPTPPKPFFSADNAKLKKDGIISFNLPAGHSCPGKGECFGFCYAMQGPQSWPAAMKKRVQNWGLAERPDFVDLVNKELQNWGTGSKKKMGDIVRIHDSGDFYSQDYIDKWHDIAKANPNKKFYAYTKALNMDWKKLHNLPNFTVIQSVGSKHDHLIDPELPHSYIFPSEDAMKEAGYVDTHESDLPAANAKNHPKIGLVIHGVWSKNLDPKFGKEFKGEVKTDEQPTQPTEKKQASLVKSDEDLISKSPKVSYTPEVVMFDQPDQLSQLHHSPHWMDYLLVQHAKNHGHGSHGPSVKSRMEKAGLGAPQQLKPKPHDQVVRQGIEDVKKKFYGTDLQKSEKLQKQTGTSSATPPPPPPTQGSAMNTAATSVRNAFGGGGSGVGDMISGAASAIKGAFSGPSLGSQISEGLTNLGKAEGKEMTPGKKFMVCAAQKRQSLQKDDAMHPPKSPEDEAHDVVEEGQSIRSATKELGSNEKISSFFKHLRSLRNERNLRSQENQAAGSDRLDSALEKADKDKKSDWKPFMSE